MAPLVSVIVSSYNYAGYIGEAVRSVLEQTYRDFEVIVVDDGSTDDTMSVLEGFGDRIQVIYQQNQGKSIALNRGIAAASGCFLAFIDSDDVWLPDSLEVRLKAFESFTETGVVYSRTRVIDKSGRVLPFLIGGPERYPGETFRSLLCGVFIPFVTFMVKRDCLRQAGEYFDPQFGAVNDWELFLRLSRVCKFHFLDGPVSSYRIHGSNWSGNAVKMADEMIRLVEKSLSMPDLPANIENSKPVIYSNLYTNIGLGYFRAKDGSQALRYFLRAARLSRNPSWNAARISYLVLIEYLKRSYIGAQLVSKLAKAKQRINYFVARLGSGKRGSPETAL